MLLGLEHEYRVVCGAETVKFDQLIHDLRLGQPNLDPADPNAYRMPFGAVFTSDGDEAEIALPPVSVLPGFTTELIERDVHAQAHLASLLPSSRLDGYSTHLSVTVPTPVADKVARLYIATFAPAMMLLLDGIGSPGLLVRPRHGRLELGGEFAEGPALAAAAAFAIGSVRVCMDAVVARRSAGVSRLTLSAVPDDHRYGWFVSRTAFGGDLYAEGRAAHLPLKAGGTVIAQQHLEACRVAAASALAPFVAASDLEDLDRVVNGKLPLPCEVGESAPEAGSPWVRGSVFGDVLVCRQREAFEVAPVMATWDTTVLLVLEPASGRVIFVNVPREDLPPFLEALDRGELDAEIVRRLRRRLTRRTLARRSQTTRFGYFDRLGSRQRLLPKERRPMAPANSRQ